MAVMIAGIESPSSKIISSFGSKLTAKEAETLIQILKKIDAWIKTLVTETNPLPKVTDSISREGRWRWLPLQPFGLRVHHEKQDRFVSDGLRLFSGPTLLDRFIKLTGGPSGAIASHGGKD